VSAATDQVLSSPVSAFLDRLAAPTPTPGGGSVAALAGALSCAMARMVAAYSDSDAEPLSLIAERLDKADRMFRALVGEDIAAYEALSAATREAKSDPAAADRKEQALIAATLVPLEMAAAAATALTAMDELKARASKYLLSDLGVAAVIARACAEAAAYSVRVNLAQMGAADPRREFTDEIDRLVAHAADLSSAIEAFVGRALK
jgi:formiminotetrahydrofolate cyclodeaminase